MHRTRHSGAAVLLRLFWPLRCLLHHLGAHIFEVFLGELTHALWFEVLMGWWPLYDRLTLNVALCGMLPVHNTKVLTTRGNQLPLHGDCGTGFKAVISEDLCLAGGVKSSILFLLWNSCHIWLWG